MIVSDISTAGPYFVEVKVNESLEEENATFQMYLLQAQCLYWNEIQERWSTEGCTVSQSHCQSEKTLPFTCCPVRRIDKLPSPLSL